MAPRIAQRRRSALWGTLTPMLVTADATGQTIALLITFVGIGILVNVLIIYIVAQVLGERERNRERREGHT